MIQMIFLVITDLSIQLCIYNYIMKIKLKQNGKLFR
jgi:hypothetical protein